MRDINVIINKAAGCRAKFMPWQGGGHAGERASDGAGNKKLMMEFGASNFLCARVSTRGGNLIDI